MVGDIWQNLKGLSFGEQGAALSFTERLARENGWTKGFAARVVEEYRRFAFLAATEGGATPSDEVDQAWHLHMTYTRHYWGAFAEALGAPLHHEPTKGGVCEREKFAAQYEKTLADYRRVFRTEPPADIWPPAAMRFGEAPFMRRINMRRHFIVPKWRIAAAAALAAGIAALGAIEGARARAEEGAVETARNWIESHPVEFVAGFIAFAFLLYLLSPGRGKGRRGEATTSSGCGGGESGGKHGGHDSGCGSDSGCGGCGGD